MKAPGTGLDRAIHRGLETLTGQFPGREWWEQRKDPGRDAHDPDFLNFNGARDRWAAIRQSLAREQRGLECGAYGCRRFRVGYTRP
jgi:hypothetical protein